MNVLVTKDLVTAVQKGQPSCGESLERELRSAVFTLYLNREIEPSIINASQNRNEHIIQEVAEKSDYEEQSFDTVINEVVEDSKKRIKFSLNQLMILNEQAAREQMNKVDYQSNVDCMLAEVDLLEIKKPITNIQHQAEIINLLNVHDLSDVSNNNVSYLTKSQLKFENGDKERYESIEDQSSGMRNIVFTKSSVLDQNSLNFMQKGSNFSGQQRSSKHDLSDEMKPLADTLIKKSAIEECYQELVSDKQKANLTEKSESGAELDQQFVQQKFSPLEDMLIKHVKANDFIKVTETKFQQTIANQTINYIQKQQFIEQILLKISGKTNSQDNRMIKIELHPKELGVIEVAIDYTVENKPKIEILTDRFTTYDLLQSNAQELEHSLMEIGVNIEAGGLNFGLREEEQKNQNGRKDQLIEYADNQDDIKSGEGRLIQIIRSDKEIDFFI